MRDISSFITDYLHINCLMPGDGSRSLLKPPSPGRRPENKTRVNHGIWIFYESITQAVRVGGLCWDRLEEEWRPPVAGGCKAEQQPQVPLCWRPRLHNNGAYNWDVPRVPPRLMGKIILTYIVRFYYSYLNGLNLSVNTDSYEKPSSLSHEP